ncbi:MAG: DegT/DnrJ/EryC1/StrS family aminotransferase [Elusimicrobiota bacterium]
MSTVLAINGGQKARTKPFPARKPYGEEEIKLVTEAINSQNLFRWGGKKVSEFEKRFCELYGMQYSVASTSGSSAIHLAVAAINPNPGDEIITAPVTDMGTILGILMQNAIPVFADVDPENYIMDPKSIESKITKRTKAILVVHLFGNPADMDAIMSISKKHNVPVIEDSCQAYMTYYKDKLVGTIGDIGCFSMQQSKHATAGDGGITITNNEKYFDHMQLFMDKGWARKGYGVRAYHFLGVNYRMNELTGAVAVAQLDKVETVVKSRRAIGDGITQLIKDVKGVQALKVYPGGKPSYWLYGLKSLNHPAETFAKALTAEGVSAGAGYIGKPIYICSEAMHSKATYGTSHCPFDCQHTDAKIEYKEGLCPVCEKELDNLVCIGINEDYSQNDGKDIATAIQKVAENL